MNDAEVKRNLPPLTTTEIAVVKKNRVEFKSFQENITSFERGIERINYEFTRSKIDILNSLEKLKTTTGRARFNVKSAYAGGHDSSRSAKQARFRATSTKTHFSNDSFDAHSHLMSSRTNSITDFSLIIDKQNSFVAAQPAEKLTYTSPLINSSIFTRSKSAFPVLKTLREGTILRKKSCRLKEKPDLCINEILYTNGELFARVCERIDSLPRVPKEVVKEHKQKDPVFAKRHKNWYMAKINDEAPVFDRNDMDIKPPTLSRHSLLKKKDAIIKSNVNTQHVKQHTYQLEMENAFMKSKSFLETI